MPENGYWGSSMDSVSLDSCKDRLEYLKNNLVSIHIDAQQITILAHTGKEVERFSMFFDEHGLEWVIEGLQQIKKERYG